MSTSKKIRLLAIAAVAAGIASFAASTSATADHEIKLAGFTWPDETVYRPDCPSNDRDRGWSSGGPCYDKSCR
jgi:hypothetical protein